MHYPWPETSLSMDSLGSGVSPEAFEDISGGRSEIPTESTMHANGTGGHTEDSKTEDSSKRERGILLLTLHYAHHREVITELNALRKTYPNDAPLEVDQETQLFTVINDGLTVYDSLGDTPAPSPAEKRALTGLVAARQFIYAAHSGLVGGVAKRYANPSMLPFADAVQEGHIGLAKAIGKFDLSLGNRFATYATWWIRQAITKAQADIGRPIRLPSHPHDNWVMIQQRIQELAGNLQRLPTTAEIATATGLTAEKVGLYMRTGAPHLTSLDEPLGPGGDTRGGRLLDPNLDPDTHTAQLAAKLAVASIFQGSNLTDKEKLVLGLRHDLYQMIPNNIGLHPVRLARSLDYPERMGQRATPKQLSYTKIGRMMGISGGGAEKLYKEAVRKAKIILEPHGEL